MLNIVQARKSAVNRATLRTIRQLDAIVYAPAGETEEEKYLAPYKRAQAIKAFRHKLEDGNALFKADHPIASGIESVLFSNPVMQLGAIAAIAAFFMQPVFSVSVFSTSIIVLPFSLGLLGLVGFGILARHIAQKLPKKEKKHTPKNSDIFKDKLDTEYNRAVIAFEKGLKPGITEHEKIAELHWAGGIQKVEEIKTSFNEAAATQVDVEFQKLRGRVLPTYRG